MPRKTGPYILLMLLVGLAYVVDFATYDEYGSFTISVDAFSTEIDDTEAKSAFSCPDSIDTSRISFLPEPPLMLVTLSLESDEITKWLGDSLLIPRAPPHSVPVIRF